jgi:hypothetical protein
MPPQMLRGPMGSIIPTSCVLLSLLALVACASAPATRERPVASECASAPATRERPVASECALALATPERSAAPECAPKAGLPDGAFPMPERIGRPAPELRRRAASRRIIPASDIKEFLGTTTGAILPDLQPGVGSEGNELAVGPGEPEEERARLTRAMEARHRKWENDAQRAIRSICIGC